MPPPLDVVRSLAVSYACVLGVAVPGDVSNLAGLLQEISTPEFQPKNKTVIVDEALTRDDILGTYSGCSAAAS